MKRFLLPLFLFASTLPAAAAAQGLSFSVRGGGGMPLGAFAAAADSAGSHEMLAGAQSGFGFGLDAALNLTQNLGLYAGFDQVRFGCEMAACAGESEYKLAGFTAGVQMSPARVAGLRPWVRGGVTFNELDGQRSSGGRMRFSSERAPGFELGAGVQVPILGVLAISPQVRYVGHHARVKVPGVEAPVAEQNVAFVAFNVGFGFLGR